MPAFVDEVAAPPRRRRRSRRSRETAAPATTATPSPNQGLQKKEPVNRFVCRALLPFAVALWR